MAPQLTAAEQDFIMKEQGKGQTPVDIHAAIAQRRQAKGDSAPDVTSVRRFLKGMTHKRGRSENRGRKKKVSRRNVLSMNATRRKIIKKVKGTRQVKWDEIVHKSRAPSVHRSTASRAFKREGIDAQFRRSREKPQRTEEHEAERVEICGRMRLWPLRRFTEGIDMIMDNKKFDVPTSARAREGQARQKVIGQIRTPQEGLEKGFTKPNSKRHRMNPGGSAHVCAGVSNGRVVLWEYFSGPWNGEKAAEMYRGPIIKILKKKRGVKAKYLIAEDNDPTGSVPSLHVVRTAAIAIVVAHVIRFRDRYRFVDHVGVIVAFGVRGSLSDIRDMSSLSDIRDVVIAGKRRRRRDHSLAFRQVTRAGRGLTRRRRWGLRLWSGRATLPISIRSISASGGTSKTACRNQRRGVAKPSSLTR